MTLQLTLPFIVTTFCQRPGPLESWHPSPQAASVQPAAVTVFIPMQTHSENRYRRQAWQVTAAVTRKQRGYVALALYNHKRQLLQLAEGKVQVILVRVGARRLDADNLQGSLKAVRDGVAAQLSLDDSDCRISWCYEQETTTDRREHGVRITISGL